VSARELLERPFGTVSDLVRAHARERPRSPALLDGERRLDYAALDVAMDAVAAALRGEGGRPGEAVAICAGNSLEYALLFLGAMRAGLVPALVPPGATAEAIAAMIADSGARLAFREPDMEAVRRWSARPAAPVEMPASPGDAFNIIYSSGTTGAPKGIVQPLAMRWTHMQRGPAAGYAADTLTLIATPLYSNTTLVAFFPSLAMGGAVAIMGGRFDPGAYLERAERHRATHTMLVPVQYQRLMAYPEFARHDLSRFRMKLSTSSHFPADLKRQVLDRWPGGIIEYYGMTEGGATCVLRAHEHRDKLHTVGRPAPGVDLRLVDEQGREVARGEAGEIVGRSAAMMTGYHNRPEETARAEWHDAEGRRYIRTGDVARIDDDGFVVLLDRRKDLIISGGFNVYPSDLEAVLRAHPAVEDAAVVGVASERWGETPVGFAVVRVGQTVRASELLEWANARLGKVQRMADVRVVPSLPRNALGKVLKRELKESYARAAGDSA
jgi:acyl-CoA synthetase (AMP-forming)/AMP-acid ligase II